MGPRKNYGLKLYIRFHLLRIKIIKKRWSQGSIRVFPAISIMNLTNCDFFFLDYKLWESFLIKKKTIHVASLTVISWLETLKNKIHKHRANNAINTLNLSPSRSKSIVWLETWFNYQDTDFSYVYNSAKAGKITHQRGATRTHYVLCASRSH